MSWTRGVHCVERVLCVWWHHRQGMCGLFGRVDLEAVWEFVDLLINLDEVIEGHINVPNCIEFIVGEKIGDEVMFVGARGVDLGEEDFGHVGKAFCEDFDGLALFVRIIQTLAFERLCSHFKAEFVCDPCRFVGESLECRALSYPLRRLHGDRDLAGRWVVRRIVLRLQECLAFAVELSKSV